jgi:hypothetical protein
VKDVVKIKKQKKSMSAHVQDIFMVKAYMFIIVIVVMIAQLDVICK